MPYLDVPGLPGMRAARTASHRTILRGGMYAFLSGGKTIAGGASRDPGNTSDVDVLRAGLLMGKISSVVNSLGTVGFFAPSILGVTTNAEAIGATSIEASAAVITELVRRCGTTGTFKLTGPPSAAGVVATETVTYSAASGTTITATAIVNAYVAGSFIQPTDGSETPLSFIPDGFSLKVTDLDGTSTDIEWPNLPIGGELDASQLINWPSDTSLQRWIVNRLCDVPGGKFVFDHIF
jgi:hypothetical protein